VCLARVTAITASTAAIRVGYRKENFLSIFRRLAVERTSIFYQDRRFEAHYLRNRNVRGSVSRGSETNELWPRRLLVAVFLRAAAMDLWVEPRGFFQRKKRTLPGSPIERALN
jgi:hypothetical protein